MYVSSGSALLSAERRPRSCTLASVWSMLVMWHVPVRVMGGQMSVKGSLSRLRCSADVSGRCRGVKMRWLSGHPSMGSVMSSV